MCVCVCHRISDTEVLERASSPSVHSFLQKAQARWAGHVVRMPDSRLPTQLLYGELCQGKRSVGREKKRFKDCLKACLKSLNIDLNTWEMLAQDRPAWKGKLSSGARASEARRISKAQTKRAVRKARAASTATSASTHMYPTCGRAFRSRIGLISHLRTHRSSI